MRMDKQNSIGNGPKRSTIMSVQSVATESSWFSFESKGLVICYSPTAHCFKSSRLIGQLGSYWSCDIGEEEGINLRLVYRGFGRNNYYGRYYTINLIYTCIVG